MCPYLCDINKVWLAFQPHPSALWPCIQTFVCCVEQICRETRLINRWRQSFPPRLALEKQLFDIEESIAGLKARQDMFEELEEREAELEQEREAGDAGLLHPDSEEAARRRTAMFTSISEDSTTLLSAAYEVCQNALTRQHALWEEKVGVGNRWDGSLEQEGMDRQWECMRYWRECEVIETEKEDALRAQMDEIAAKASAAVAAANDSEVLPHFAHSLACTLVLTGSLMMWLTRC